MAFGLGKCQQLRPLQRWNVRISAGIYYTYWIMRSRSEAKWVEIHKLDQRSMWLFHQKKRTIIGRVKDVWLFTSKKGYLRIVGYSGVKSTSVRVINLCKNHLQGNYHWRRCDLMVRWPWRWAVAVNVKILEWFFSILTWWAKDSRGECSL